MTADQTDQVEETPEGFSPDVRAVIDAGLAVHRAIPTAEDQVNALLRERRALILKARQMGVSGYVLSRVYGVSQTTVGNWSRPRD